MRLIILQISTVAPQDLNLQGVPGGRQGFYSLEMAGDIAVFSGS